MKYDKGVKNLIERFIDKSKGSGSISKEKVKRAIKNDVQYNLARETKRKQKVIGDKVSGKFDKVEIGKNPLDKNISSSGEGYSKTSHIQKVSKRLSSLTSLEKALNAKEKSIERKENESPREKTERLSKEAKNVKIALERKKAKRLKEYNAVQKATGKKELVSVEESNMMSTAEFYRDDNKLVVRYNNAVISLKSFLTKAKSGDVAVRRILDDIKELMKEEKFDGNLIQYIEKNFGAEKNPLDVIKKKDLETKFNKD